MQSDVHLQRSLIEEVERNWKGIHQSIMMGNTCILTYTHRTFRQSRRKMTTAIFRMCWYALMRRRLRMRIRKTKYQYIF